MKTTNIDRARELFFFAGIGFLTVVTIVLALNLLNFIK